MNQDAENKQCQICHGYLFEDDDVVVCPECGAPHHRECWQSLGHCGVQDDHGTENEYSKRVARERENTQNQSNGEEAQRFCRNCGKASGSDGTHFCPYCGKPFGPVGDNDPKISDTPFGFKTIAINLSPCGSVPKDSKIEDCKAGDLAKFVGSNSHRYIPKFASLSKHNKISWNWAAFLFPSVWFFARKMYLNGALFFMLMLASNLCFLSFSSTFSALFDIDGMTQSEIYRLVYQNVDKFSLIMILLMIAAFVLNIIPRIVAGRYADWIYRGHAIDNVKRITNDPSVDDVDDELMRKGNISLLFMILALLAEQYLPSIIGSFII